MMAFQISRIAIGVQILPGPEPHFTLFRRIDVELQNLCLLIRYLDLRKQNTLKPQALSCMSLV